jgi:crotonobetainyl-CoA:carnitine CoA-transferase CaiB-like acyl-CoA transferase
VRITAPPFHIDGEHLPPPKSAPWTIGQDTMEVLENLLNYDQEKIKALKLSGLI